MGHPKIRRQTLKELEFWGFLRKYPTGIVEYTIIRN